MLEAGSERQKEEEDEEEHDKKEEEEEKEKEEERRKQDKSMDVSVRSVWWKEYGLKSARVLV